MRKKEKVVVMLLIILIIALTCILTMNSLHKDRAAEDVSSWDKSTPIVVDDVDVSQQGKFIERIEYEPALLASFLLAVGELDEFVEIDSTNYDETINSAVRTFAADEKIYHKAIATAKKVLREDLKRSSME